MLARVLAVLAAAVLAALLAGSPQAATPSTKAPAEPSGTYEYDIIQETYGKIGTHTARFARAGDDLVVTTRIRIDVRLLFVTIYRFESDGREVWRDGRLVRFETTTNDNGAKATVKAWAMGDKFVIERPDGRLTTNDRIYTTHAWNRALVGSPVLLEPTSGKLYMVGFADGGDVKLAGSPARTYAIAGEIEGRLWYAPDGTWLRMDLVKHGGIVSVTLTSAPARKGVAVARRPGAPTAGATASGT